MNGKQPVRRDELVIKVRDYGAMGDGTTDDAAAINAALTAGAGGEVLFPKGTYLITGANLVPPSNTIVRRAGKGTVLATTTSNRTGPRPAARVTDLTIRDLKITGAGTSLSSAGTGVVLLDASRCLVSNVTVENLEHQGIEVGKSSTGSTDVVIHNCRVSGATKATAGCGIVAASSNYCRVVNCTLAGNPDRRLVQRHGRLHHRPMHRPDEHGLRVHRGRCHRWGGPLLPLHHLLLPRGRPSVGRER